MHRCRLEVRRRRQLGEKDGILEITQQRRDTHDRRADEICRNGLESKEDRD